MIRCASIDDDVMVVAVDVAAAVDDGYDDYDEGGGGDGIVLTTLTTQLIMDLSLLFVHNNAIHLQSLRWSNFLATYI